MPAINRLLRSLQGMPRTRQLRERRRIPNFAFEIEYVHSSSYNLIMNLRSNNPAVPDISLLRLTAEDRFRSNSRFMRDPDNPRYTVRVHELSEAEGPQFQSLEGYRMLDAAIADLRGRGLPFPEYSIFIDGCTAYTITEYLPTAPATTCPARLLDDAACALVEHVSDCSFSGHPYLCDIALKQLAAVRSEGSTPRVMYVDLDPWVAQFDAPNSVTFYHNAQSQLLISKWRLGYALRTTAEMLMKFLCELEQSIHAPSNARAPLFDFLDRAVQRCEDVALPGSEEESVARKLRKYRPYLEQRRFGEKGAPHQQQ